MLFNSYSFIFIFIPVVLFSYYFLCKLKLNHVAQLTLIAASLVFYAHWNINYTLLIIISIAVNYLFSYILQFNQSKLWIVLGITFNLLLLSYYKYADFFINNTNTLLHTSIPLQEIVLPLAISFFTFHQIGFLVDTYLGKVGKVRFDEYVLFVSFFPQLIAGPIVRQHQIIPQLQSTDIYSLNSNNLATGFVIFTIGLFKKVIIADTLSPWVTAVAFDPGQATFFEAWGAAAAYAFQLYFDFSGYSDMAIGLGKMFNIDLPLNFNSPYKAKTITEFWRRWHITLSSWFNDYLFTPLYIKHRAWGKKAAIFSLMTTFFLIGLWHGATWTCAIFGIMHGTAVCLEMFTRKLRKLIEKNTPRQLFQYGSMFLVFIFWAISLVFFKQPSLTGALAMLKGMFLFHGASLSSHLLFPQCWYRYPILLCLYLFVILAPNTKEFVEKRPIFKLRYAVAFGMMFALAIIYMNGTNEFIYFQF